MFALKIQHHLVVLTTECNRTKRMNNFFQNQGTIVISEFEETQEEERSGKTSFFKSARLCSTVLTYCSLTDWSNPLKRSNNEF